MLTYLIDLISKPWVGSLLGILGLIAAIFFYFKAKRKAKLAYQYRHITIVGGSDASFPSELQISFSGKAVPQVTSSRVVLWNAGNTTVGGSQIVDSDPLRLEISEDAIILKTSILKVCREVNGCNIKHEPISSKRAAICFDFLDPGDGMAFEVLHTGDRGSIELSGTLRGMLKGVADYGTASWQLNHRLRGASMFGIRFPLWFSLILGIGMITYGVFKPQIDQWKATGDPKATLHAENRWLPIFCGILYTGMPAALLWMRRRRYPGQLEIDEENPSKK